MSSKEYTRPQLEEKLSGKYKNRVVTITYPKYPPVTGKIDEVAVDHHFNVIIQMNNKRYSISPECVYECVKLL
jgi:hypothetical protein